MLTSYLVSIPDVLWGTVIGSVMTLVGVMTTNRHHLKQIQLQHAHDADQNEKQRLFTLRNELYLEAVGEIVEAQRNLTKLSEIDLTRENIADEFNAFFVALSRAAFAASDDTSKALSDYSERFSKSFFDLLERLLPIQEARTERDIQDRFYTEYTDEVARVISAITRFNEEGKENEQILNTLNRNYENAQRYANDSAKMRESAWQKLNALSSAFKLVAIEEGIALSRLAIDAIVCMRSELGLHSNLSLYKEIFEERADRQKAQLEEFLAKMDAAKA